MNRPGLGQMLLKWSRLEPEHCYQPEEGVIRVVFDGYAEDLKLDDLGTCAEPAFRNHVFAAVCYAIEQRSWYGHAFKPSFLGWDGERLSYRFGYNRETKLYEGRVRWQPVPYEKAKTYLATLDERADAMLAAWLMVLREAFVPHSAL